MGLTIKLLRANNNVTSVNERMIQEMCALPKEPVILLSYINTQLRDHYASLDELCRSLDVQKHDIATVLSEIGYSYEPSQNQFR